MKRRSVLAALGGATTGVAGCLGSVGRRSSGGDDVGGELREVPHTPDGVSAAYGYFVYDESGGVPGLDDEEYAVLTDASALEARLDREEVREVARGVDLEESFLVVSRSRPTGEPDDVLVDVADSGRGLRVDVYLDGDGGTMVTVVLLEVTGDEANAESVTVDWLRPVECEEAYVPYHRLPDPVRREVDVALTEGRYEPDGPLLYSMAVSEDATLWKESEYYRSRIDDEGGTEVLRFEPTTDESRRSPANLYFYNRREEALEVAVVITDVRGEPLVEEKRTLDPEDDESDPIHTEHHANEASILSDKRSLPSVEIAATFDEYDLVLETDDGELLAESIRIDPDHGHRFAVFSEDDDLLDDVALYSEFDVESEDDHLAPGPCNHIGGWWGLPPD